jgi:hypothetical protein
MGDFGLPELNVLAIIVAAVVILVRGVLDFRRTGKGSFSVIWTGAVVGGIVGFFLRPSVPMIGQLPLGTVLSRGSNLSGLDVMLKGAAETSFNYMVAGAVVGGIVMALFARKPSPLTAAEQTGATPSTQSAKPGNFCTKCGTTLSQGAEFCGSCGTKNASA